MKLFRILLLTLLANSLYAQELPVLVQKYTDGLAYNPSVAGLYGSSYDFAYQKKWSGIGDPYSLGYLSMQTPLVDGSIGTAFNVFYEKVNLLKTVDLSAAVAYHFLIDNDKVASFGLNVEYGNTSLDLENINVNDAVDLDPALNGFNGVNKLDFAFGANFRSNYFQAGVSANRLLTLLKADEKQTQNDLAFQEFFTGYAAGFVPLQSGRDMLELRANYRRLLNQENLLDIGAFYEYNQQFMLGATYRTNSSVNVAAAITFMENFTFGYAREIIVGEFSGQLGASDEITLRYTFDQVQSILNNTRGGTGGLGSIGGSINRLNVRKGKYSNTGRKSSYGHSRKKSKEIKNFTGPKKRKKNRRNKKFLWIF
ncbi:MAG: hypothetical protein CMO01_28105 [Thalassobius sp.]|nr:hypothetical protein [Thalassovita sp.]